MNVTIHTDGGSRGNPGHSGFGVVINADQGTLYEKGVYLGIKTNNEAEYAALIHGLTWLKDNQDRLSLTKAEILLDSELVVNQLNGRYKVKAPHLFPLYQQCLALIASLSLPITITHVRREFNAAADSLANSAMDRRYN